MTSPLNEFIEHADETMDGVLMLSRRPVEDPGDAQIAIVVTANEEMDGATLIAVGSVGNKQDFVTVTVSAFDNAQQTEPTVAIIGNEVIVTLATARP